MSRLTIAVQSGGKSEVLVDEHHCAEVKRDRHKKPAPRADTLMMTWRTVDGRMFRLQIEEVLVPSPSVT